MGGCYSILKSDLGPPPPADYLYPKSPGFAVPPRDPTKVSRPVPATANVKSPTGRYEPSATAATPATVEPTEAPKVALRSTTPEEALPHSTSAPQISSPVTPTTVISWTKGELIGMGAFGSVVMGLNNYTGELMAVKQVQLTRDERLRGQVSRYIAAVEQEIQILKDLQHPNIVQYLGTEKTEDNLNIFLEYVPGGSIASLLGKFGPLPEAVVRKYTKQILQGLNYLHQNKFMHRDIKGANILVDGQGTVKLADFGASKKIENLATIGSGSKSMQGTPYWMAPEVIQQTGHAQPADIWSLACVVIEMFTGKPPWVNGNNQNGDYVAAMFKIASASTPPPFPDSLSPEARNFLTLCFNRVPRDRPNAARLLQHPFVVNQLGPPVPKPLPLPVMSPPSPIKEDPHDSPDARQATQEVRNSHLQKPRVSGPAPIARSAAPSVKPGPLLTGRIGWQPPPLDVNRVEESSSSTSNVEPTTRTPWSQSPSSTRALQAAQPLRTSGDQQIPPMLHNMPDSSELLSLNIGSVNIGATDMPSLMYGYNPVMEPSFDPGQARFQDFPLSGRNAEDNSSKANPMPSSNRTTPKQSPRNMDPQQLFDIAAVQDQPNANEVDGVVILDIARDFNTSAVRVSKWAALLQSELDMERERQKASVAQQSRLA